MARLLLGLLSLSLSLSLSFSLAIPLSLSHPFSLLRSPSPSLSPSQSSQVDPSLQPFLPIEYVHVEKTGTSILNTLMHIPGVCPLLPSNAIISQEMGNSATSVANWWTFANDVATRACNSWAWDVEGGMYGRLGHYGIEKAPEGGFSAGSGRFMMIMRQPEQRMVSKWHYYTTVSDNCPLFCVRKTIGTPKDDFFSSHEGEVTKILTRNTDSRFDTRRPTRAELDEAKVRLQTGFFFVGILEQFNLSVCLFNVMFNQTCRSLQFVNSHPTHGKESSAWDTAELNGWRDSYDNELYDIAKKMFEANLKKYNVSDTSCEPCFREAGLL
mmetsp:Transcript_81162/g.173675  ORF Transcript_81162/g.173675 Transcript_81162/m.173675 type:complete len:326 (+) Transcript_81162:52-1029(+)